MKKYILLFCCVALHGISLAQSSFQSEWEAWRGKREQGLTDWRNLAGLFWLEEGVQSFGFSSQADHVFPTHRSPTPSVLGFWVLKGDIVLQSTSQSIDTLYSGGKSKIQKWGSWEWFVIRRGDKWAIRVRDKEHPELEKPLELPHYPVDANAKVKGTWKPSAKKLTILDITGQVSQQPSAGTVTFTWKGKKYPLETLGTTQELFFLVADQTNATDTYGGGRYLYSRVESDNQTVWLDFNRLYNPPCAFTPFATCPLPPKENILKTAIQAGEKRVPDAAYH